MILFQKPVWKPPHDRRCHQKEMYKKCVKDLIGDDNVSFKVKGVSKLLVNEVWRINVGKIGLSVDVTSIIPLLTVLETTIASKMDTTGHGNWYMCRRVHSISGLGLAHLSLSETYTYERQPVAPGSSRK